MDFIVCDVSVYSCNLVGLKCVHEMGYKLDWYVNYCAVKGENMKCIRYLCENNCPWHDNILFLNDYIRNVCCLKYMIYNNLLYGTSSRMQAALFKLVAVGVGIGAGFCKP